jgi:hypothetical protein
MDTKASICFVEINRGLQKWKTNRIARIRDLTIGCPSEIFAAAKVVTRKIISTGCIFQKTEQKHV